jgi:hypothetical protein
MRMPELSRHAGRGVIGREAGGRAVMADQLEFVAEMARWPNVHMRIVKLADGP